MRKHFPGKQCTLFYFWVQSSICCAQSSFEANRVIQRDCDSLHQLINTHYIARNESTQQTMGNSPGFRSNLEEKLCGSCYDDYKCSLWKKNGRGKWWHIPRVARRGHAGCLKVLMQAGTSMDKYKHRSVYHEALEEAATWGRIACVKILVRSRS